MTARGSGFGSREGVAARVAQAQEMAAQGYTSRQIAPAIGIAFNAMSNFKKRHNLVVPADAVIGRTAHHDSNRFVRTIVDGSLALSTGADLIDYSALNADDIEDWVDSLNEAIRFLTTLKSNLKKEQTQRV